jgi:hypothetical protein
VRGQETPTQLGPLERASLNRCSVFLEYRTMGKVQKPNSPECHIPSSEPFKVNLEVVHRCHKNSPLDTVLNHINPAIFFPVDMKMALIRYLGCYIVLLWATLPTFRRHILPDDGNRMDVNN